MKTIFTRIAALSGLTLLVLLPARALDFNMDGSTGVVGTVRSGEPEAPVSFLRVRADGREMISGPLSRYSAGVRKLEIRNGTFE